MKAPDSEDSPLLHYVCEWIVLPIASNQFDKIYAIAVKLGCYLVMHEHRVDKNSHLHILSWALQTRSKEVVDEFLVQAKQYIDFINLKRITSDNFTKINMVMYGRDSGFFIQPHLDHWAIYNQAAIEKTPMWGSGCWTVQPINQKDIDRIIKILEKWRYILWYDRPVQLPYKPPYDKYQIRFFAVIDPVTKLDEFLKVLSPFLDIHIWDWFYNPAQTMRITIDKRPLNRENAAKFLQMSRSPNQLSKQSGDKQV